MLCVRVEFLSRFPLWTLDEVFSSYLYKLLGIKEGLKEEIYVNLYRLRKTNPKKSVYLYHNGGLVRRSPATYINTTRHKRGTKRGNICKFAPIKKDASLKVCGLIPLWRLDEGLSTYINTACHRKRPRKSRKYDM